MVLQKLLESIRNSGDRKALCYPNNNNYLYSDILHKYEMYDRLLGELPKHHEKARYLVYVKDPFEYICIFMAVIKHGIAIPFEIAKEEHNEMIIGECKANYIFMQEDISLGSYRAEKIWSDGKVNLLGIDGYREDKLQIDENVIICYFTSGTTGKPKCVMFSDQALYNNINNLAELIKIEKKDVCYTPISPMMTGALNTIYLPALLKGASVAVNITFLAGSVMKTINSQGVTILFMVPLLYTKMLESNSVHLINWKSIRMCLTSSSYMSEIIFKQFHDVTNICISSIYCSSECGVIAVNDSNQIEIAMKYVGHPLKGTEVEVIKDGKILDAGEYGELVVAGINNSQGYLNYDNSALGIQLHGKTYYKTGDYGAITENGVIISGRIADTMNIAGHLVDPIEIENVLVNYEKVVDASVFSCIDDKHNEYIVAKVQCVNKEICMDDVELKQYCRQKLSDYKIPSKIIFVDEIERTANGKKVRRV